MRPARIKYDWCLFYMICLVQFNWSSIRSEHAYLTSIIVKCAYLKVELPFGLKLKLAPDEVIFVRLAVNLIVVAAVKEANPLNLNADLAITY